MQVELDGSPAVGGYKQCLEFPGAATLDPIKYINGLAEAVVAKGGQIYEQTRVRKPDTSEVTTMAGNKVCIFLKPPLFAVYPSMRVFGKSALLQNRLSNMLS